MCSKINGRHFKDGELFILSFWGRENVICDDVENGEKMDAYH